ncbi:FkbM family methyltransferase [Mesorhizobium sp. CO1-1-7]|uniref:FkbM family methyltransferase n=1 Tax=Mesorhizobium sp. CO1-1-7 TaxID=2876632 RepID=UPI001CD0D578|nr:FkbM family methyltransferase [Mesorhizobium sp. CO1-1-7]MBZ9744871.1 FkbM family methyltransferase [Mesorhizobium sp. CO1-1-7]
MITSYAQNFEDVILWRALKSVEKGFYIDIGAQDPVLESVSLSFYEQGWRGVHVEPTAHYAAKLRDARPDEEVIEAAIGTGKGLLTLHEFPGTGLSTGDPAIAKHHAEAGFEMKEIRVPLVSLQHLLDRNAERDIHWLKIDVEGMESAVIESWGSSSVRPWIVVVESTIPLTNEESHDEWDLHLKGLGYEFVYFDGLNRFYISENHPELKNSFGPGPNYFDEFVLPVSSKSNMLSPIRRELDARDGEIARLQRYMADGETATVSRSVDMRAVIEERDAEIARLQQRLADMNDTTSRQLADGQAAIEARDAEIARFVSVVSGNSDAIANLKHDLSIERSRSHEWWLRSETLQKQIEEIYKSRSWKLIGPYRRTGRALKRIIMGFGLRRRKESKRRSFAVLAIHFVLRRPKLKALLSKYLRRHPTLFNLFRNFAIIQYTSGDTTYIGVSSYPDFSIPYSYRLREDRHINKLVLNSPDANRIFLDLEYSLKKRREI